MWPHLQPHAAMLMGAGLHLFFSFHSSCSDSSRFLSLFVFRWDFCDASERIWMKHRMLLRDAITETDKWSLLLIHPDLGSGWSTSSRHQHPTAFRLLSLSFTHSVLSTLSTSLSVASFHNSVLTISRPLQLPFVFVHWPSRPSHHSLHQA